MTDIMTPALGESVTEATVARWAKQAGEVVKRDEVLVELETDKVSLEVVAPQDGVLGEISAAEGDTVLPGQRLGRIDAAAGGDKSAGAGAKAASVAKTPTPSPEAPSREVASPETPPAEAPSPAAASPPAPAAMP